MPQSRLPAADPGLPIARQFFAPPPGESIADLLALHGRINHLIKSNMMSDDVLDPLTLAAGNLRFDVANTPARNLREVAAKIEFFFHDHLEVGECEELAHAMRTGIAVDLERLEVAHA